MKVKKTKLEWYVLRWDFNKKDVVNYNILTGIAEDIAKEVKKKHIYCKSILREYLKTVFMYDYWSRTEYEMLVRDLHENTCKKIDVWRQIEPNLDKIVNYINNEMELKFE